MSKLYDKIFLFRRKYMKKFTIFIIILMILNFITNPIIDQTYGANSKTGDKLIWEYDTSITPNVINSMVYGNGLNVAVGEKGTIKVSKDGLTWEKAKPVTNKNIVSIAYGDKRFIAITSDGIIITSTDGYKWSINTKKYATISFNGKVYWDGKKFIIVGFHNNKILVSSNGSSWESNITSDIFIDRIAYNGKKYAVVSQKSIYTSDDLKKWTKADLNNDKYIFNIIWTGNEFLAVGVEGIYIKSDDGNKWDIKQLDYPEYKHLVDIAWNGSVFVTFDKHGVHTSVDGIKWISTNITSTEFKGILWNGKKFIMYGQVTAVSDDGFKWSVLEPGKGNGLTGITSNGKRIVAIGNKGTIISSSNRSKWENVYSSRYELKSVACNGECFIVVGYDGTILRSTNGIDWYDNSMFDIDLEILKVKWLNNMFIAVGRGGLVYTSEDGIEWEVFSSNGGEYFIDVTWDGSKYVVLSLKGELCTFIDGQFNRVQSNISGRYNGIAYGKGQFIVVGESGIFKLSSDLNNTNKIQNAYSEKVDGVHNTILYEVIWDKNRFIIVGEGGIVLMSKDGTLWSSNYISDQHFNIMDIAVTNKGYLCVGYEDFVENGKLYYTK